MATLTERLELLAACLCGAIEGSENFCFCGVMAGSDWADLTGECVSCESGQAWVRLARIYPSTVLGQQDTSMRNCATTLGMDIELGVLRCMPIEGDGTAPSEADFLAASVQQLADARAIRAAVACCESFPEYIMGQWSPIGPQAGIVGGLWTIFVSDLQ